MPLLNRLTGVVVMLASCPGFGIQDLHLFDPCGAAVNGRLDNLLKARHTLFDFLGEPVRNEDLRMVFRRTSRLPDDRGEPILILDEEILPKPPRAIHEAPNHWGVALSKPTEVLVVTDNIGGHLTFSETSIVIGFKDNQFSREKDQFYQRIIVSPDVIGLNLNSGNLWSLHFSSLAGYRRVLAMAESAPESIVQFLDLNHIMSRPHVSRASSQH